MRIPTAVLIIVTLSTLRMAFAEELVLQESNWIISDAYVSGEKDPTAIGTIILVRDGIWTVVTGRDFFKCNLKEFRIEDKHHIELSSDLLYAKGVISRSGKNQLLIYLNSSESSLAAISVPKPKVDDCHEMFSLTEMTSEQLKTHCDRFGIKIPVPK